MISPVGGKTPPWGRWNDLPHGGKDSPSGECNVWMTGLVDPLRGIKEIISVTPWEDLNEPS
jgi:hypothetical protein